MSGRSFAVKINDLSAEDPWASVTVMVIVDVSLRSAVGVIVIYNVSNPGWAKVRGFVSNTIFPVGTRAVLVDCLDKFKFPASISPIVNRMVIGVDFSVY